MVLLKHCLMFYVIYRELFFRNIRITPERFDHLLSLVKEQIEKKDTCFRKSIPAAARLVITLRYLASGETQSLSYSYHVGRSIFSNIVSETCIAIYEFLKDPYLKSPPSVNDWKYISERFKEVWNFSHVVGTIDGKDLRIECPTLSGTLYHNCKGVFNIVLLAVCDADYCFTLFDFGRYSSINDCGVLANSLFGKGLESKKIRLAPDEPLDVYTFSPLL